MRSRIAAWAAAGLFAATSLTAQTTNLPSEKEVYELDDFLVEEAARAAAENLLPQSALTDDIFGRDTSLLEIPRSLTTLTPEALDAFGVVDFDTLTRFGAGTQRINYFGLPGTAFLRGTKAGVYFDGMLRAYQRNEYPTSFGSAEGLDIVRGPAPAHQSPTLVGGYVNLRPKRPYFDRFRGSAQLSLGSWQDWRFQLDAGGPIDLLGRPAAYRVSISGRASEDYFDRVENAYESVYVVIKTELANGIQVEWGGEFYDYRSSEVPGINRPTHELLATDAYVVGEPADLTSSQWGHTVVRHLLEFPYSLVVNPSLHALGIPGERARQEISSDLRAAMLDLNDPEVARDLYSVRSRDQVPGFLYNNEAELDALLDNVQAWLDQVDGAGPGRTQDLFIYTPEYFSRGGQVLTEPIEGHRILSDHRDYADARNWIGFLNLEAVWNSDTSFRNKWFFEALETAKYSSYGFAFSSVQFVAETKLELEHHFSSADTILQAGVSLRGSYARMKQDFDAEPFSRRDLTRDEVSANSVVIAGDDVGPDGLNFWSSFGGASDRSQLYQAALYAFGRSGFGSQVDLLYSLRLENDHYVRGAPGGVDRAPPGFADRRKEQGHEPFLSVALNPIVRLGRGMRLYGALQMGTAIGYGDGGTVAGEAAFTQAELYEIGLKGSAAEGALFYSLASYYWDQATFSSRDAFARPIRGKGVEAELSWALSDQLALIGSFTAQRVNLKSDTLGFGAVVSDAQDWALRGGLLTGASDRVAPNNPEMVWGGFPELTGKLHLHYEIEDRWSASLGAVWQSAYWHNFERTLRIPSVVTAYGQLQYTWARWTVRLSAENLANASYWTGQDPIFAANTLISKGRPRSWALRLTWDF